MNAIGSAPQFLLLERGRQILGIQEKHPSSEVRKDKSANSELDPDERGELLLTIPELFIAASESDGIDRDYLVLILPSWVVTATAPPLILALPEAVRSSLSKSQHGITVTDLAIGPGELNCEGVSLGVYRVGRKTKAQRILDSLQDLAGALDFSHDYRGSVSLGQAILDRIELLDEITGAEVLFQKHVIVNMDAEVEKTSQYCAFIQGADPEALRGKLWVTNKQLAFGDSSTSASQVLGSNYVLFRLGYKSRSKDVRRYIDELRRKHALRKEELSRNIQSESYLSYLEKEREQRKQEMLNSIYGHHRENTLPVVTPIAVEVAANLEEIVKLEDEGDTLFGEGLKELREELSSGFGVMIPGVRIRLETELPDGKYIVLINEVPLVNGTVDEDKGFCRATVDNLGLINLLGEEAEHPFDGSKGRWVGKGDWEQFRKEGYEIYGAGELILLHLEDVLRNNLRLFLTIDELVQAISDDDKEKMNSIHFFEGGIVRFRDVISSLLEEGLPVDKIPFLVDEYLKCEDMPAYDISEKLRSIPQINNFLTREVDDWRVFSLSQELENVASKGIRRFGDTAALVLEPEVTQDILTAVRNEVGTLSGLSGRTVIVVRNGEIRPHLKKLIDLEFPMIWVVAEHELKHVNSELLTPASLISFE